MKHIRPTIVLALLLMGGAVIGAADTIMDPFFIYSPRIMGQGGSFTAIASGHEALFTNPAGFGSPRASLTIGSLTGWYFGNPVGALVAAGGMSSDEALGTYGYDYGSPYTFVTNPEDLPTDDPLYALPGDSDYEDNASAISNKAFLAFFKDQAKYGFGGGGSLGISLVGRGLGLGFIAGSNLFVQGDTFPFGVSGLASTTLAIVGGFAMPVDLFGTRLVIGGDLRPMIRVYSKLDSAAASAMLASLGVSDDGNETQSSEDAVFEALNGTYLYQGAGLGIDLGAMWEIGDFTIGLSVRDLFDTRFAMYKHQMGDFLSYVVDNGGFPSNEPYLNYDGSAESPVVEADGNFVIPMTVNLGLAFHPDFGGFSFFFDPIIHADLVDPVGVFRDKQSPWALLHLGTEVKVLRFIKVRAGINQGYVTGGIGARILFLDVNASIFTRELGPYAGDRPSTGVTFEAALRF